jgi:hypothetical protein
LPASLIRDLAHIHSAPFFDSSAGDSSGGTCANEMIP